MTYVFKKICIYITLMIWSIVLLGPDFVVYAVTTPKIDYTYILTEHITTATKKESIQLSYGMTTHDEVLDLSNNSKKSYLILPQDTMLMQGRKYYQGNINNSETYNNNKGQSILRISADHNIQLIDMNGKKRQATFFVENTQGYTQSIPIYSSDDGTHRSFHSWGQPINSAGHSYITFQTDHFSYFLVGDATGLFTINNDASVTSSQNVTLNLSNQSNLYQMRFGNTTNARDSASWISYTGSYTWTLTAGNGNKTVYAEIKDSYGNTGYVQDDILLARLNSTPSGLKVHLDGSQGMLGVFNDISGNGNNGTPFNGVTTGTINGETYMCFNGSNRYIEIANNAGITVYPFTISARVKTNSTSINGGIISLAQSTATNVMYNLEHNLTFARTKAQNTTARLATATSAMNTAQRFLLTSVFTSATSRNIYVNGISEGTNATSATFNTLVNRINIGRFADSTPSNYFNGCVDDIRVYNTELTSGQIYDLYTSPAYISTTQSNNASPLLTGTIDNTLDRITININSHTYTGTNNGNGTRSLAQGAISPALADGIYTITMNVINPYDRSVSYTGSLTIDTTPLTGYITYSTNTNTWQNVIATLTGMNKPFLVTNNNGLTTRTFSDNGEFIYTIQDVVGNTLNITAKVNRILTGFIDISMPSNLTLPTLNTSSSNQTLTVGLNDTISIADRKGSTNGYYTTLQSSELRSNNGIITADNISFQASGLQLIGGNIHPNIDLAAIWTTSFVDISSPTTFISRMGGTAGIKSHYGTSGSLRIIIPAYTAPDRYEGMLTLTIYEL